MEGTFARKEAEKITWSEVNNKSSAPDTDAEKKASGPKRSVARTLARYLFSHVGLCIIVGAYCVAGTYLFMYLEAKHEKEDLQACVNRSQDIDKQRQNLAVRLELLVDSDDNGTMEEEIQWYQNNVTSAINDCKYNGTALTAIDESKRGWQFASALLFAITIVTTIGYGHVTPHTMAGQLVVIAYALIGIPLMLMFLANVGDVMAHAFRIAYARGCCYFCWKKRKQNYENNRRRIIEAHMRARPKSAWHVESEKRINSIEASNTTQPLFGGGARNRAVYPTAPADAEQGFKPTPITGPTATTTTTTTTATNKTTATKKKNDDDDEIDDEYLRRFSPDDLEDPDDELINVPITLTLVVIAVYVFLGALLFSLWEQWTLIEASYFSFVTLATIGFGDYVPGWKDIQSSSGQVRLFVSIGYIVIGLAVLSMSFNLMMEEMIAKFRWLGQKLGIVDEQEKKDTKAVKNKSPDTIAIVGGKPPVQDKQPLLINDDIPMSGGRMVNINADSIPPPRFTM